MSGELPFRRRTFFDEADLVGARWWQESLAAQADPVTRRAALTRITLVLAGVGAIAARRPAELGGISAWNSVGT